jgi:hypothetical protein
MTGVSRSRSVFAYISRCQQLALFRTHVLFLNYPQPTTQSIPPGSDPISMTSITIATLSSMTAVTGGSDTASSGGRAS